ncbi:MAG: hypothetical protein KGJ89_01580 [Patescibacteria group bacterium]|nr:hypothetical protein [Patescibacteria group bacterium]MDE2015200.1 hypothetical protein [Patescibacteria group bacterium]MDE2226627.1 hypothetical protein [Patescibacteria group bacterium]
MKKLIIIAVIIIIIVAVLFLVFIGRRQTQQQVGGSGSVRPLPVPVSLPQPTDQTISLQTSQGSIVLKNFYNTAVVDNGPGAVNDINILMRSDIGNKYHYEMGYERQVSRFDIVLNTYSLEDAIKYRKEAEADFLNILGINEPDACKLNVDLIVNPTYVSIGNYPPGFRSETNYGLSFCQSGLPLQ